MRNRKLLIALAFATVAAGGVAATAKTVTPVTTPAMKIAAKHRATAAQKEAQAFLDTLTPLLTPVATAAAEADWVAATDVTPEHTGQRAGADKVQATLSGAPLIIQRTKALLAHEKDLDDI